MDFRNKKVTVVGMGESGLKAALLLHNKGAIVSVTDAFGTEAVKKGSAVLSSRYIEHEIGGHTEKFLKDADAIVLSPGVENSAMPVKYAEERNIPIFSEIDIAYLFCEGKIIAVTGTNGKSTVTRLLGDIFTAGGRKTVVCGNIGNAFSGEIDNITKDTFVILEVSSFQLERIKEFRPNVSIVLNITEDHLDRYKSMDGYIAAKRRVFENQSSGDFIILNHDGENARNFGESYNGHAEVLYFSTKEAVEGASLEGGAIKLTRSGRTRKIAKPDNAGLKGAHNSENVLAAALAADLFRIGKTYIEKALKNFKPLHHRIESAGLIGEVMFLDDSKATNIDSAIKAIESMERPTILIAGGKDKNLSYEKTVPAVKKKVKEVILIGETRPKMKKLFKSIVETREASSMEEAVRMAYRAAKPGDAVLLSPMCSSFDMFRDYKQRGEVFKRTVEELRK